jgi:hypothetical protein
VLPKDADCSASSLIPSFRPPFPPFALHSLLSPSIPSFRPPFPPFALHSLLSSFFRLLASFRSVLPRFVARSSLRGRAVDGVAHGSTTTLQWQHETAAQGRTVSVALGGSVDLEAQRGKGSGPQLLAYIS